MNGETAGGWGKRYRHHTEFVDADAGKTGLLALCVFVGEKSKGLVFLERAAEGQAALRARVGLLDRVEIASDRVDLPRKGVASLESLIAKVPKGVTVKFVGAALADDVNDTAAGAAVLGVVVAQNELKLLYALLRESRANGDPRRQR